MKCQGLFSENYILKCRLLKLLPSILSIKNEFKCHISWHMPFMEELLT